MLHHLDDSLESYFRALVPLPPRDVDVSFDTPDRQWGSGVTRPTLNLFLWDVRRSQRRASTGMEEVTVNGRTQRRRPPPQVEFRYLVTAWAAENRDQHQLLGAVLRTIVSRPKIPIDYLQGELAETGSLPSIELAAMPNGTPSELWSALDGQLKAGLDLMVTIPVDTGIAAEAGPPTESVELRSADRNGGRKSGRKGGRQTLSEGPAPLDQE